MTSRLGQAAGRGLVREEERVSAKETKREGQERGDPEGKTEEREHS